MSQEKKNENIFKYIYAILFFGYSFNALQIGDKLF